jgi:hypothetical protein
VIYIKKWFRNSTPSNSTKLKSNEKLEIGRVPFNFYSTTKQNMQMLQSGTIFLILKVRKFQNEFIKSSLLPKYDPKIVRISAL